MSDAPIEIETRPDWESLGPQFARLVSWFIDQCKGDLYVTTHYNYFRAITMVSKCGGFHESPFFPELSSNLPSPIRLDKRAETIGDIISEKIEEMYK